MEQSEPAATTCTQPSMMRSVLPRCSFVPENEPPEILDVLYELALESNAAATS
jgi:hypothetical protein